MACLASAAFEVKKSDIRRQTSEKRKRLRRIYKNAAGGRHLLSPLLKATFRWTVASAPKGREIECAIGA